MSATFLPAHRQLVLALAVGFFVFGLWASLAELDVVVSAHGKLVPSSFVKVAQPSEGGVVRAVFVRDGEHVAKDQQLVELDPVTAGEDARASGLQLKRLRLQLDRIDAELAGRVFVPDSMDDQLAEAALRDYQLRQQALKASISEATAAQRKSEFDLVTAQERLVKARQLLPLVDKQTKMQRDLAVAGFVSQSAVTDKERDLVDASQEVAVQVSSVASARAALTQAASSLERVVSDYRRQLTIERAQVAADLTSVDADLTKKAHRLQLTTLRSPVAGVVNGLSTLSVGQVVASGATLLTIVPDADSLRFEGWMRNEDVADVVPGMPAKVKVSAFPFQKYGWAEAEVAWIGADSETPETMRNAQGEPLYYRVRLDLKQQHLAREGKGYDLKPGMQAVGDVRLEKRTLLEYLTSPTRRVLSEAAREK